MTTTLAKRLIKLCVVFCLPLAFILTLAVVTSPAAHAAGTVGDGTPASCTEAALQAALAGGGLVTFNCGPAPHAINVNATIVIASNTTIDGGGLITIQGNNSFPIFDVANGPTLALFGLTVKGGSNSSATFGGGAVVVRNGSSLTAINSTFTDNFAQYRGGAIYVNGAAATIVNSTLANNSTGVADTAHGGGAIYAFGSTVLVKGSSLLNNTAADGDGGAIRISDADLTVVNSTFFNNRSLDDPAAGSNDGGDGGAIGVFANDDPSPYTILITNTTIYSNSAQDDGGGIRKDNKARIIVKNSIVAGNAATSGSNCSIFGSKGFLTSAGNNLENENSCSFAAAGDLANTDPTLGPLADNGGQTLTLALLPGSPAINAGDDAACLAPPVDGLDQRGVSRPQGATCDIGAFEANPVLQVAKTSVNEGGDPLQPGERITYTIVIANNGGLDATGTVISDTFPANTSFVNGSLTIEPPAAGGAPGTQPILADGLTVAAASVVTVTYAVTVDALVPDGTDIVNIAAVTSAEVATPVTATVTDTVGRPDLVISKTGPATADPGQPISYTLTVTNNGSAAASNLVITDTLPSGATYVSGGTLAGNEVRWNVANLPGGGAMTQQILVVSALGTITNSDYGVSAEGGYSAVGNAPVVTEIGGGAGFTVYLPLTVRNFSNVCRPDVADIIATGIVVTDQATGGAPVAGQPANIAITIENCGGRDATAQEFWVDLYLNPDESSPLWPISQNELYWQFGAGAAYSEVLAAGQSKTQMLSATFPAGTHRLYVQVDSFNDATTYGVVNEGAGGETNNVFGPATTSVGAAANAVGQFDGQVKVEVTGNRLDRTGPAPRPAPARPSQ